MRAGGVAHCRPVLLYGWCACGGRHRHRTRPSTITVVVVVVVSIVPADEAGGKGPSRVNEPSASEPPRPDTVKAIVSPTAARPTGGCTSAVYSCGIFSRLALCTPIRRETPLTVASILRAPSAGSPAGNNERLAA